MSLSDRRFLTPDTHSSNISHLTSIQREGGFKVISSRGLETQFLSHEGASFVI